MISEKISTNYYLHESDAFFRRLIIINVTSQFLGDKDNPNLIDELTTDKELSGLLYECLIRLPRVLQKGIRPTTNEILRQTFDKYSMSTNPTKHFFDRAIINEVGSNIPKRSMYESYALFCRDNKLSPVSEQSFSREMTKITKDLSYGNVDRLTIDGKQERCYIDVKIVNWKAVEDEAQTTLNFESDD